MPSSSEARAPVEIQNATSARSRSDPSAANSLLNQSSGIARGIRFGTTAGSVPSARSSTRPSGCGARGRAGRGGRRPGGTGSAPGRSAVAVEVVEPAQHRLAMRHRRRRIALAGRGLAGHRVRLARGPRGQAGRPRPGRLQPLLDRQLDPAAEIPRLCPATPGPTQHPLRPGTATTAAGQPHTSAASPPTSPTPSRSRRNTDTGSVTTPLGPTTPYGSRSSPVAASLPATPRAGTDRVPVPHPIRSRGQVSVT